MCPPNLEDDLRNLKFAHLTRDELDAYCDDSLDELNRTRVEEHLKQCLSCSKELSLLMGEDDALNQWETSNDDVSMAERLIDAIAKAKEDSLLKVAEADSDTRWRERIEDYVRRALLSLQGSVSSSRDATLTSWKWQSHDGRFKAAAATEGDEIAIHFSSGEAELTGASLNILIGVVDRRTVFKAFEETQVVAEVSFPCSELSDNVYEISIQIMKYSARKDH
jgi:hypothetical protein